MIKFFLEVSDGGLFGRSTAVMRNRCNVPDNRNIKTDRLNRTHGGLASGAWAFDQHFNFLQAMSHGLAACVLGDQLRSVRGALPGSLKSNFTRARPTDHIAVQVGDRDDCVVKSRQDVSDSSSNVFAT